MLAKFGRLSPRNANVIAAQRQVAISYYMEHDYAACVATLRRQLSTRPDIAVTYCWLAAALGQLGRIEEARAALARAPLSPTHELAVYGGKRVPWMRPEDHAHLLEGLRKAGWSG